MTDALPRGKVPPPMRIKFLKRIRLTESKLNLLMGLLFLLGGVSFIFNNKTDIVYYLVGDIPTLTTPVQNIIGGIVILIMSGVLLFTYDPKLTPSEPSQK
jgi:ABC-type Mn2+/Zn2+ transport system permease subunit